MAFSQSLWGQQCFENVGLNVSKCSHKFSMEAEFGTVQILQYGIFYGCPVKFLTPL